MKINKIKILFTFILSVSIILGTQLITYAANEGVEILQKNADKYIIYINENLGEEFEFAFSNDKNIEKESLSYKLSETDSSEAGNNIAYVNEVVKEQFFNDSSKKAYLWAKKNDGTFFAEGIEIDLNASITEENLEISNKLTKIIKVDITTTTSEDKIDDVDVTTTIGKIVLPEGNYKYQLIKPTSAEYQEYINLAERIFKLNSDSDFYTRLKAYREFYNLYYKLSNELVKENWNKVENNEVIQPEDAQNGEKYVLWLYDTKNNKLDVQFLTCVREYTQEKIKEKVTTKLPVTYDNNTLLIVFGGLIVAIIIVSIRIKSLKGKEEK